MSALISSFYNVFWQDLPITSFSIEMRLELPEGKTRVHAIEEVSMEKIKKERRKGEKKDKFFAIMYFNSVDCNSLI